MKKDTNTKEIKTKLNEAGKTALQMLLLNRRLGSVSKRDRENYAFIFDSIYEACQEAGYTDLNFGYASGYADNIYQRHQDRTKLDNLNYDLKNCSEEYCEKG